MINLGDQNETTKIIGVNEGKVNRPYYKKMWLSTNNAIVEMAIDGSITTQKFVIKPLAGEIIRLERLTILIQDDGIFDSSKWGVDTVMINGMNATLKQNGTVHDLTGINPIRTTAELGGIMYDLTYHKFDKGDSFILARFTFNKAGQPFRLIGDNGDEFAVEIRDNLTTIVSQTMVAQGSYENQPY